MRELSLMVCGVGIFKSCAALLPSGNPSGVGTVLRITANRIGEEKRKEDRVTIYRPKPYRFSGRKLLIIVMHRRNSHG